jgi:hypothetical protein
MRRISQSFSVKNQAGDVTEPIFKQKKRRFCEKMPLFSLISAAIRCIIE